MISLSTSVFKDMAGDEIVSRAIDLGFQSVELNFELDRTQAESIISNAAKKGLTISSLHNYVPEPPEGEFELFLCDIDSDRRQKAIHYTGETIRLAADIGAQAVVLHMGEPRVWDGRLIQKTFRQMIFDNGNGEEIKTLRENFLSARKDLPHAYLDCMLQSLDKVALVADTHGIKLGIENRYWGGQFPNHDEIGILLQEFSGAPIGYWHDCGHAFHNQYCGLLDFSENLKVFESRIVGFHLHDAHLWNDHQIPSTEGQIDFKLVKPFIRDDSILVLELGPWVELPKIPDGIAYLKSFEIE